ncbi:MAG TPA: hypothetical protein PLP33_24755 [Leptospiraceae bacterium]|nr:hypothetical protein [Leptospiraceae bacterium]
MATFTAQIKSKVGWIDFDQPTISFAAAVATCEDYLKQFPNVTMRVLDNDADEIVWPVPAKKQNHTENAAVETLKGLIWRHGMSTVQNLLSIANLEIHEEKQKMS